MNDDSPPGRTEKLQSTPGVQRLIPRVVSRVLYPPEPWQRTVAAILAATLSVGAAIAVAQFESFSSYSLIVLGMAVAAWYAGLRFAFLCLVLALPLSLAFIAEPQGELTIESGALARLCLAFASAFGVAFLVDTTRRGLRETEVLSGSRQQLLEEVSAREARLSTLADSLPVLISYVDSEQRYTFNNRVYEDWFGRDRREISGRPVREVLGEEAYEAIQHYVESALDGSPVRFESLLPYKDAGTRWVQADYVPDIAADGTVRGFFALMSDQTERRQSVEKLAESEARARGILEAAQDGIITIDEAGVIQSMNPAAERLFGYEANELLGRNVNVLMPQPHEGQSDDYIARYLRTGRAAIIGSGRDVEARRKDGSTLPIHLSVSEVRLPAGRLFTGIIHDLTNRVRAENELRLSERRYHSLVEATSSVVWAADANARILEPQPEWEVFTGQKWPDYQGTGFIEMVHPDDRRALMERWQSALSTLSPQAFPARVWHAASHSWHHCDTFAVPLKSESGEVVEWIGTTHDVEDRYQVLALEQLRSSDERSRLAESVARLGLWEWDLEARLIWSPGLAALCGFDDETEASLKSLEGRIHEDDREHFTDTFSKAAQERHGIETEFRVVLPDGATRWLQCRGSYMAATASMAARMVGIFMDVTESVESREALREKEERERFLSDATKELISSMDVRQLLTEIERLAIARLGDACSLNLAEETSGPTQFRPSLLDSLMLQDWRAHPRSEETVGQILRRGEEVFAPFVDHDWIRACAPNAGTREKALALGLQSMICLPLIARGRVIGRALFAITSSSRHFDERDFALAKELIGRTSAVADNAMLLQELRETADELRYANAAKDEFLGMVSHELRTPITVILGNADILRRMFKVLNAESTSQALEDIYASADRLQLLIDNLLMLARMERGHKMQLAPLDISEIAEQVLREHRNDHPQRKFKLETTVGEAIALASPGYVEQVMNNLVSNAEKYSPEETPILVNVQKAGDEVIVDVLDRGKGIAPEEAEALFQPFYRSPSTAGTAPGIGVGLAVCKRIAEAQGGRIWARPRPDGGSDFGFALPAA